MLEPNWTKRRDHSENGVPEGVVAVN